MVTMLRSMLPFLIVVGHPALHGNKEEEARKDRPSFVCPFLHQRFPSGGGGSERETLRARSSGGERAATVAAEAEAAFWCGCLGAITRTIHCTEAAFPRALH